MTFTLFHTDQNIGENHLISWRSTLCEAMYLAICEFFINGTPLLFYMNWRIKIAFSPKF